jgi:hypothetical protein
MKSTKLKKLLVKKSSKRIKEPKLTMTKEEQENKKFKDLLCEMIQKEAYLGASLIIEDKLRQIAKEKSDRIIDLRTENHT